MILRPLLLILDPYVGYVMIIGMITICLAWLAIAAASGMIAILAVLYDDWRSVGSWGVVLLGFHVTPLFGHSYLADFPC
jgi:hypothetical protein